MGWELHRCTNTLGCVGNGAHCLEFCEMLQDPCLPCRKCWCLDDSVWWPSAAQIFQSIKLAYLKNKLRKPVCNCFTVTTSKNNRRALLKLVHIEDLFLSSIQNSNVFTDHLLLHSVLLCTTPQAASFLDHFAEVCWDSLLLLECFLSFLFLTV